MEPITTKRNFGKVKVKIWSPLSVGVITNSIK